MKLKPNTETKPFKSLITERPWGYYGLYSDNEKCTAKILYVKKEEQLSLQYHFLRAQYYLILDNNFIIEYSNKPIPQPILEEYNRTEDFTGIENFMKDNLIVVEAKEGDEFGFHECVIHRASYTGTRDYGRILDLAFGHNDEEDIVRIRDKYHRK